VKCVIRAVLPLLPPFLFCVAFREVFFCCGEYDHECVLAGVSTMIDCGVLPLRRLIVVSADMLSVAVSAASVRVVRLLWFWLVSVAMISPSLEIMAAISI